MQKNLTQRELAEIIGVSGGAIGMYESDKRIPDRDILVRIADYFDVSLDYLLGRSNVRKSLDDNNSKSLEDFLREQEVMFDGVPLTDEDKESILQALKLLWRRRNRTDEQK